MHFDVKYVRLFNTSGQPDDVSYLIIQQIPFIIFSRIIQVLKCVGVHFLHEQFYRIFSTLKPFNLSCE